MRWTALILIAACDPGFHIVATIHDDKGPVAGATLRIDCPDPHRCASFPDVSDASGKMDGLHPGPCCTRDSVLTVLADGYLPAAFVVEDVCTDWTTQVWIVGGPHNRCDEMRLDATLQRTAP